MAENRVGRSSLRWVLLCAATGLLLSSCNSRHVEVTGKVTYNGNPVTAGTLFFVLEGNESVTGSAILGPDGSFKGMAPVGKVKAAVQTLAFKPRDNRPASGPGPGGPSKGPPAWATKGSGKDNSAQSGTPDVISKTGAGGPGNTAGAKYVPIPAKYEKVETTDLEFTIQSPSQDLGTIELK